MPADREREDLERELRELGGRIDYPPTPDVARRVRRRLEPEPARPRGGRLRAFATSGWAAAVAVTLLFASAVLWAATHSPFSVSSGGAGAGGAGASGSSSAEYATGGSGRDGDAAGASAGAGSSTASSPPGVSLGLGERISASEARDRVGTLLLPETPELASAPSAMYAGGPSGTDGAVLVYPAGPGLPALGGRGVGLVLAEAPGDLRSAYPDAFRTGDPPEDVEVGGNRGYWFPDGRTLRSQPGDVETLSGGALLWEEGGVTLLLRAGGTKDEALRVADSIR